jgi:glucose/arabinose dehydrogenase
MLLAWISFGAAFLSQAVAQRGTLPGDSPQRPPSPDLEIPRAPVLEPLAALQSFVLPPGFRIELVASEPLVRDPVMMTFDVRGRIWIAELPAYNFELLKELPLYLDMKGAAPTRPFGRVVILEDTDGDGRADKRIVYADNLDVPRAISFVGNQVLIGDPPNLWLTRDSDGDDVMDEKVLLTSDYGTPDNIEQSPNGLLWGRDNWLYNANYKSRWRLVRGEWQREPMPALGQWGLTQDDFGRLFYNTNSDQLRGDLLPSHYIAQYDRRMPLYGFNLQLAMDQSTWPARPTPGVNRGYREGQLREDGRLATFTAAAAPLIYRGSNFPERFVGNAFVPEPAGNLVKRNLLVETEGRITALHGYHGVEFLASTDERFRPVHLANAPDGTLYMVDFYRGFLEEYRFVTGSLGDQVVKRGLNQPLWGLGRIYRIVYDGRERAPRPDFAHLEPPRLVERLTDDNGWTRDAAQRLIVESGNADFVPALRALLARAGKPRDRVSTLWCLEGLQRIELADIEQGLSDQDSHVRIAAETETTSPVM